MNSGSLLAEAKGLATITGISLDVLIIAVLILAFAAYALYFGKRKIVSLILSLYGATALYLTFPYQSSLILFRQSPAQVVVSKLLIFAVFAVILHILFNRFIVIEYGFGRFRKPIEVGLLSFSATCLVLTVMYYIIPSQNLHDFGPMIDGIFTATQSPFWWLAIPIAILFFVS